MRHRALSLHPGLSIASFSINAPASGVSLLVSEADSLLSSVIGDVASKASAAAGGVTGNAATPAITIMPDVGGAVAIIGGLLALA